MKSKIIISKVMVGKEWRVKIWRSQFDRIRIEVLVWSLLVRIVADERAKLVALSILTRVDR